MSVQLRNAHTFIGNNKHSFDGWHVAIVNNLNRYKMEIKTFRLKYLKSHYEYGK